MFLFGIFTTHLPYIAMVLFYAYILIFGVNQVSEGHLQLASKSESIQILINQSGDANNPETINFYDTFDTLLASDATKQLSEKQKWKFIAQNPGKQNQPDPGNFFNRPPPQLV